MRSPVPPRAGRWAAVLVAALTVAAAAQAAPTAATSAAVRVPVPRAALTASASSPAATGASDIADLGSSGWDVQSSAAAPQSGAQISAPGFAASGWLPVGNDDAGAPGTEIEALARNGRCPGDTALQPVTQAAGGPRSVFYSDNMRRCYGFMNTIGPETVSEFSVPWWWRTDFTASPRPGQAASLIVNGVIGSADVWVNGTRVATSATVTGAYAKFAFDISGLVRPGLNSVALEVSPNDPTREFTVDNVDWTQVPPDNNTGIQFPVQLRTDGALAVGNSHVNQSDAANLSSAALTVKTDVTNTTATAQSAAVTAAIIPPGAGPPVTVSRDVTVPAGATQTVSFTPGAFPVLTLRRPRIWWPYQLGAQPLYTLRVSVARGGTRYNSTTETFGIRTVASYLTGSNAIEPHGARAFKINGVPLVIRGGGWSPNLFLHYSAADTARQIALIKNMGLNAIRLEGHIMPADWFEQMDAAGILVNGGYQCCDAWETTTSPDAAQRAVLRNSAQAIGTNLRNHPDVFSYQWSDNEPSPAQESPAIAGFEAADFYPQTPLIASAEYKSTATLGPAGEKEGPYDWVPPDYWYDTAHLGSDDTVTNAGAAWGFDSEESAGDTVPTLDSLDRFMSPADLADLWKKPAAGQYHLNYEPSCQIGYSFGTLCHFDSALSSRYGTWTSLSQYVELAQAQDYENTRAQFEAFIDHAHGTPLPATGTIYWQMNKGWPSMLWNLYNSDGDQAGSYFGALEADKTLHASYALDNGTVTLSNLGRASQSGLSVEATVYDLAGKVLDDQTSGQVTLSGQQVLTKVLTPRVPAAGSTPVRDYFVELRLRHGGAVADRNVYWLSTQPDVVNWSKTLDQPQATMKQYANLKSLQSLPRTAVSATAATAARPGPDGADRVTTVTITDTSPSAVAFLIRADVRRGTAAGQELPGDSELRSSTWRDNDVTLFPGESQTLTVTYDSADLRGAVPVISLSGWNLPATDIPAPAA